MPAFNAQRSNAWEEDLPLSSVQQQDVPRLLRMCCKKLPFGPLPRNKEDGHFQTLHPKLQRKYYKQAWESGIADMTWKCWACLAHSQSLDYETLADIHYGSKFNANFKRQRIEQIERHLPGAPSRETLERNYTREAVERARVQRLRDLLLKLERESQWEA